MRWSWLRAAVLGLMIGPAPVAGEPAATGDPFEAERSFAKASGHVVRGPGFYVWEEDARQAAEWALELRRHGSQAAEWIRWREVATRSAPRPPVLRGADGDEAELAMRMATSDEGDAGVSPLGALLCLLPSLDRTWLIASCATCSDERTRLALARALSAPFEAVGAREAIEYLQEDPSTAIRRLARSAAASRRLLG